MQNKQHKYTLIGLDLGTSAIKGVLTDASGRVLAESIASTRLEYPASGMVEFDGEHYYQLITGVIRELAQAASAPVVSLAMAAAAGNTVVFDHAGTPLRPVISWLDQRSTKSGVPALSGISESELHQITGWPCVTTFPLAHLGWLHEHQPEMLESSNYVGVDVDWLIHKLTGQRALDLSTATTMHLVDQVNQCYHYPLLKRVGIDENQLPELKKTGSFIAPLCKQAAADTGLAATTRVVAGCFDHAAAARATNTLHPGQLMFSCGTSWVGFMPCNSREQIIALDMLCDPFMQTEGGAWAGMFSLPAISQNIRWYIENLIAPGSNTPLQLFNKLAAAAPAGAGGVRIDLKKKPEYLNREPALISRAVMEGAARLLWEKLLQLSRAGIDFEECVMVGGASRSQIWVQIIEEITGLKITSGGQSSGARGAALLAGAGIEDLKGERYGQ